MGDSAASRPRSDRDRPRLLDRAEPRAGATRDSLAANGLPDVKVSGFYRDVTLTGPDSTSAAATTLATALEATHGVTYVGTGAEATSLDGGLGLDALSARKPTSHLAGSGFAAPVAAEPVLDKAGPRFRIHDPGSWPDQARLLAKGTWGEFKALTDSLKGGRRQLVARQVERRS